MISRLSMARGVVQRISHVARTVSASHRLTVAIRCSAPLVFVALSAGCAPVVDSTPSSVAVPSTSELPPGSASPPESGNSSEFQARAPADRFVEGGIEYFEWLTSCAAENGEAIEVIYGNPPAVQWDSSPRTDEIVQRCREMGLSEGWIIPTPFDGSAEGNRLMYRLWIPVHECLKANGFPTVEPPSEQTFIDQGSQSWNPYAAMRGAPLVVADPSAASADDTAQLQAQELCGASAEALYQDELEQQEGG